jgi:signal transduction histidine kinase
LVLAATVDVLLSPRIHRFLDRTIMGRYYDVQKALRAYGQQINLILDLERLADTTLNWLRTTMRIERSAFVLVSSHGPEHLELSVLRSTHWPYPASQLFVANSRFLVHFDRHRRPLSQYDLDMLTWFQFVEPDERQWLKDLAVDLYIPILVADETVALLALGSRAGGQPYSEDDLETLMILAGQTATALENARLLSSLRVVQNDLHRLNAELAETNRQLARLDQAKTDFIAIASHELRTPLTQIYGYSDILSRLDGDDLSDIQVVNEFVAGISRGAERLREVVDAMVDVSLIDTGSLNIVTDDVPLSLVVKNVVEGIEPTLQERELDLIVQNLGELPYIQADGGRLEQVVHSLLTNAVKFTPDGGQIVISGHLLSPPEEEYVEVLIVDTGIGIDPDQQNLIFEKFYRTENFLLHSTDSVRFKGAGPGLGLAIAKGIVDAHGGRIWVESPGRDEKTCPGSAFHVRLPIGGHKDG